MTDQLTVEEYSALSRDERRKARKEGHANALLGAPVPPHDGPLTAEEYSALTRDARRRARQDGRVDHLITGNDPEPSDDLRAHRLKREHDLSERTKPHGF